MLAAAAAQPAVQVMLDPPRGRPGDLRQGVYAARIRALYAAVNVRRFGRPGFPLLVT